MLATLPELDRPVEALDENDHRRANRKPVARTTGLLYTPGGQKEVLDIAISILDLSLHGTGFKADAPLEIGKVYGLEIRGNWMNLCSRIRVVSCRKSSSMNSDFYIGAEFC